MGWDGVVGVEFRINCIELSLLPLFLDFSDG